MIAIFLCTLFQGTTWNLCDSSQALVFVCFDTGRSLIFTFRLGKPSAYSTRLLLIYIHMVGHALSKSKEIRQASQKKEEHLQATIDLYNEEVETAELEGRKPPRPAVLQKNVV